ncbi:MarR family EPS-associated transcriptional regulator [Fontisubflavum oceani]|uniref:MarR family EPS-associated transcriptional regulator n=1 Tax=Fontisubflavum oceani TaxID=2978973 RepID=UPI0025B5972E|nr:MarR family EPS-associated transcriptional regulator [Fontisubflavum oceani]WJY20961.1 MarR family EPS-associated transcriptional regulator [Fontisubflavum oceani]
MAGRQNRLQDDVRFRILRFLEQNPEMSQRDLAHAVGISTGSVHYVLKALVDKGLVKLGNFTSSEDKRRYAYLLTPEGIATKAQMTRKFLLRKREEYKALKAEIEALEKEMRAENAQGQENPRGQTGILRVRR